MVTKQQTLECLEFIKGLRSMYSCSADAAYTTARTLTGKAKNDHLERASGFDATADNLRRTQEVLEAHLSARTRRKRTSPA